MMEKPIVIFEACKLMWNIVWMICIIGESPGSYLAIGNNMPFSSQYARTLRTRALVRVALIEIIRSTVIY